MEREQIIALFPLTMQITQEMIDEGKKNLADSQACIGALALKSVLPVEIHGDINWCFATGVISLGGWTDKSNKADWIRLTTSDLTRIVELEEPKEVTFIINSQKYDRTGD